MSKKNRGPQRQGGSAGEPSLIPPLVPAAQSPKKATTKPDAGQGGTEEKALKPPLAPVPQNGAPVPQDGGVTSPPPNNSGDK